MSIDNPRLANIRKSSEWQELVDALEYTISGFTSYPANMTQDYMDKQFALHLVWVLQDHYAPLYKMIRKGAEAADFAELWEMLFDYVDNREPDEVPADDAALGYVCEVLYGLLTRYSAGSGGSDGVAGGSGGSASSSVDGSTDADVQVVKKLVEEARGFGA